MEVIVIKVALAVIFGLAIIGKLTGKTKPTFEKAGFGPAAVYLTAVAEVIFTVGLYTKFELIAALGLLAIIGGGAVALFRQHAKPAQYVLLVVTAILLLALLGILLSISTIVV
ncbi:MAG: hypothetical protein KIS77_04445 [Saprospiraceae bacterium]|nr:hypothetical protein [Saprospiraceae bacterium]